MGDLTTNFSRVEMKCRCGKCDGIADMAMEFMAKLQAARSTADRAFMITSGYRCPQHPESVKRPTSSHTIGRAADIATADSRSRHVVVRALLRSGFTRIGIGKDFIHVDDDPDKATHVIWDYYEAL